MVGNSDERVYGLFQFLQSLFGNQLSPFSLKKKWLCHNGYGKGAQFFCDVCDNRCYTSSCSTPEPGGDKNHVAVRKRLAQGAFGQRMVEAREALQEVEGAGLLPERQAEHQQAQRGLPAHGAEPVEQRLPVARRAVRDDLLAERAEQFEAQFERKREALRRTQAAAAEARRRSAEAERRRREAEYLAQFGELPPPENEGAEVGEVAGGEAAQVTDVTRSLM